ncbi:MAG: DoxX family protein [Candidatus Harrisonbacteria bacterium]|nr:DoxX family protein [Candidatus Harrisonbacteria bacterium]
MNIFLITLQIVAGLGIYNVWFIRAGKSTAYRGKGAQNLRKEFEAYGLSRNIMLLVGTIKVLCATGLLLGIWYKELVRPSSFVLSVMMLGAIGMHIKVGDSFKRTMPALLMFTISLLITIFT